MVSIETAANWTHCGPWCNSKSVHFRCFTSNFWFVLHRWYPFSQHFFDEWRFFLGTPFRNTSEKTMIYWSENTLVFLKWGFACVTNFGESPHFLDKACLAKTQKSRFCRKVLFFDKATVLIFWVTAIFQKSKSQNWFAYFNLSVKEDASVDCSSSVKVDRPNVFKLTVPLKIGHSWNSIR